MPAPRPPICELKALIHAKGLTMVKVADLMEVDRSFLSQWAKRGVPADRVIKLEEASGVSRTLLRPDLYPKGS